MQTIQYHSIPDKMFIKAVKVRDIRRARVLTRAEKAKLKPGSPDISLESPLGFVEIVSRETFTQKYKYINGKSISLTGWRDRYKYMVISNDNTPAYAMYIPPKYTLTVQSNGRAVKVNKKIKPKGDYIVCGSNPDGSINRNMVFVISYTMFKKMFKIITGVTPRNKVSEKKIAGSSGNIKNIERKELENNVAQIVKGYTAIGKLIRNNKIVGFRVKSVDGQEIFLDKQQLMTLCREKKNIKHRNKRVKR